MNMLLLPVNIHSESSKQVMRILNLIRRKLIIIMISHQILLTRGGEKSTIRSWGIGKRMKH